MELTNSIYFIYHILDMFTVEFLQAFLVMVSPLIAFKCYLMLDETPKKSLQSIYMYNRKKTYVRKRR